MNMLINIYLRSLCFHAMLASEVSVSTPSDADRARGVRYAPGYQIGGQPLTRVPLPSPYSRHVLFQPNRTPETHLISVVFFTSTATPPLHHIRTESMVGYQQKVLDKAAG